MRDAIKQLHCDPTLDEAAGERYASDREVILRGTYLRDVLLRSFSPRVPTKVAADPPTGQRVDSVGHDQPVDMEREGFVSVRPPITLDGLFRHDSRIHSWAKRYSQLDPVIVEGDPVLMHMNPTQIRAIAMMLLNKFTLVQGVSIYLFYTLHLALPSFSLLVQGKPRLSSRP